MVDLKVEFGSVQETPTFFPEQEGLVEAVITNDGNTQFDGSVDLAVYASIDSQLEKNDLNVNESGSLDELDGQDEILSGGGGNNPIGTVTFNEINLAPGESQTVNLDFTSSDLRTASVVSPGAYFLIAEVDPNNTIPESNEDNNIAQGDNSQFISTDGTNVVLDWNSVFLNAVQKSGVDSYGFDNNGPIGELGTIPPVVPRNGAILHTAVYDAVNAFSQEFQPYFVEDAAPDGASIEAAVVGAAFKVLSELYPEQQAVFNAQRDRSLEEIDDEQTAEDAGFDFGVNVAEQIIEFRKNDSAVPPSTEFEADDKPGAWKPIIDGQPQTPVGPTIESVPPFLIPSVQQFRPDGPPQFGSPRFARETEETRKVGGIKDTEITDINRSDEQTEIAQFWSYDRTDTFRPPGQWNQIAQSLVLQEGEDLSLVDTARLFALLNISLTDAGVVSWDAKFDFQQLRPEQTINAEDAITGIPGGVDFDGNETSIEDPNWDPLIETPAFPDYTSGHAAFGGAATEIFRSFFGSDNISFEIPTQEIPGLTRSFGSFSEAAEENSESRVFGGIHIISSSLEGEASGVEIGKYVFDNALLPV
ncbi:MAG: CARDB domain-containing protein [Cyanobacteria bacterium J06621_15]